MGALQDRHRQEQQQQNMGMPRRARNGMAKVI